MTTLVIDIETVPLAWWTADRRHELRSSFPPACAHEIVCVGVLTWDRGPVALECRSPDCVPWIAELLNRESTETIVTWNGRGFDLPVIVAACMRERIPLARYWSSERGSMRSRWLPTRHHDLMDILCEHGAAARASLHDYARSIGLPGKIGETGADVEQLHRDGRHDAIEAYCAEDVVQTTALWLRWQLVRGACTPAQSAGAEDALWRMCFDHALTQRLTERMRHPQQTTLELRER